MAGQASLQMILTLLAIFLFGPIIERRLRVVRGDHDRSCAAR